MEFENFLAKASLTRHQYQVDGVNWCLQNEKEGNEICGKYIIRGGFLCDDMGLGKTIQILGVILGNFRLKTLIVLPLALMKQWEQVIKKMVGHKPLVFHGQYKKSIGLSELNRAAIVLTTYGQISSTKKTPKNLLHKVKWFRIIFDEAHHMRNRKTAIFEGAINLTATNRWLVTGTPIQNKITDLYNLASILGVPAVYYQKKENLESFVTAFILRRTKESVGLQIPDKKNTIIYTHWDNQSEKTYSEDVHEQSSNSSVCDALDLKCLLQQYIRSRQTCISSSLMKSKIDPFIEKIKSKSSECSICLEAINMSAMITENSENSARRLKLCGHIFHKKCIELWIKEKTVFTCPFCRGLSSVEEITPLNIQVMEEAMEKSSKINAVIETLVERKGNNNSKIVFCHYKGEIDMIKYELIAHGYKNENVKIIDGRSTQKERNLILQGIKIGTTTTTLSGQLNEMIVLIQIQTGCEGLNLQWCNEIYFVSPHWNPSVEDQAVARCHRMGQTKPVYVFRYVMKMDEEKYSVKTLDELCVKKQNEKRSLMRQIYEITDNKEE